jgi:hypothetical protein
MFLGTPGMRQERECWLINECPEEQEDELTAADQHFSDSRRGCAALGKSQRASSVQHQTC